MDLAADAAAWTLFAMYWCGASHPATLFNKSLHPPTGMVLWISQFHVDQQRCQVCKIQGRFAHYLGVTRDRCDVLVRRMLKRAGGVVWLREMCEFELEKITTCWCQSYYISRHWQSQPGGVKIPRMTTLSYLRPSLAKRRSSRLRKKLRIAEFQELGFEYEASWHSHPTVEQQDAFLDAFIALIETRDLQLGGGPTSGAICGVRKNPDSIDMKVVHEFLAAWPGVSRVTIGEMIDVWYDNPALSTLADEAKDDLAP